MPRLDPKKLDAILDGCAKLDRRMDAVVAARRGDAAPPTRWTVEYEEDGKTKEAHVEAPDPDTAERKFKKSNPKAKVLRADATDPRAAATRELEMLKEHLTDMTEAHERERVEARITDLEAGIERMGAEAQADKGKGRKDSTRIRRDSRRDAEGGYEIEFDDKPGKHKLISFTDPAIETAAKRLGVWDGKGEFPGFTVWQNGEEIGRG